MSIFILSLLFAALGYCISVEWLYPFLPKFIQNHEYQYIKTCAELSFLLFLIGMASVFLLELFQIDLVNYYNKLPFHSLYLSLYILLKFVKATKKSKRVDFSIFLSDKRHEKRSCQYFDYILVDYEGRLLFNERKLNTLKAFSILPVALLLLNNMPEVFNSFSKQSKHQPTDYSNIALVFLIVVYIYQTYTCYKHCQELATTVVEIKQQKLLSAFPDLLENKSVPTDSR